MHAILRIIRFLWDTSRMTDSPLSLYDECSILCAGSETSEIQKSYDINETNNTGEGTNHNQDAAYDRELYRNDSDTAIRDTHCPEDEVYNDDVSCIEDPNENNLSKRFVFVSIYKMIILKESTRNIMCL